MDQRTTGRIVAVSLVVAAAAGLAAGLRRATRRGSSTGEGGPEPWACACGRRYRRAGEGRHRVYWPDDAAVGDPVMGSTCVDCERTLPA